MTMTAAASGTAPTNAPKSCTAWPELKKTWVKKTGSCPPSAAAAAKRSAKSANEGGHDLVFFSQVFFNTGHAVQDLGALVGAVPDAAAVIVIDGYHGFLALPTDLAAVEGRAFYLAGGDKYAMAGEGGAF